MPLQTPAKILLTAFLMDFLFPLYGFFPGALSNLTSPSILSLDITSTKYTDYIISRTLCTVDRSGSRVTALT